jgi:hypothetical protein
MEFVFQLDEFKKVHDHGLPRIHDAAGHTYRDTIRDTYRVSRCDTQTQSIGTKTCISMKHTSSLIKTYSSEKHIKNSVKMKYWYDKKMAV